MQVRGAPLIGAMAAYGVCLALREDASDEALDRAIDFLAEQRPTAVNLRWALEEMRKAVRNLPREARVAAAYARAAAICDEDVATNTRIGEHGVALIEKAAREEARPDGQRADALQRGLARRASIAARRWRRSTRRTIAVSRCMCGSTRRGRATRARR